jgi:WD40 repeat protein
MRDFLKVLLIGTLLASPTANAADTGPYLVVETGVHEAAVNAMTPLADGGFVTVSDDKTARIWDASGEKPVAVARPPIGPGDDGALYAVAASAKTIAVGGRIRPPPGAKGAGTFGIAFYSTQDYRPLGVIYGLPSAVLSLKMSPSGERLAAGLEHGGLRVFDLKAQSVALEDTDYAGRVTGLDFDLAGRLAVAADDASVRLYDSALHPLPKLEMHGGARAYGVAFSPDGAMLAVGDRARAVVHLFDAKTGKIARDLDGAPGKAGSFNVVAFSADGASVFGAGSYLNADNVVEVRRWPLSGGAGVDIPAAKDLVTSLIPHGKSGVLFATAEPVVGVIDDTNAVHDLQTASHIDFHDRTHTKVRLSHDGSQIEIIRAQAAPLIIDVTTRAIPRKDAQAKDFAAAAQSGNDMTVTDWRDNHAPRVNGHPVEMEAAETARSAAVSPSGAAIGTDFFLRFVTKSATVWNVSEGSPVWDVLTSGDGRVVVACLGDGTIHWYNASDGRELIALFVDPKTERLVEWTPAGYFDHDHRDDGKPDGRTLIGYRVNLPTGRASDFVSVGQLYPTWFRPDLVGLSFRDDNAARRHVTREESHAGPVGEVLKQGLPPKVTLLETCGVESAEAVSCDPARAINAPRDKAKEPASVSTPMVMVRYKVEDQGDTGQVVTHLNDAVLNEKVQVEKTEGPARIEHAIIPLARGLNVVRLSPISGNGAIEGDAKASPEIRLMRSVPAAQAQDTPSGGGESQGRMFILTVGVSKLSNPAWNLANPANDATALAAVLRQDPGHLFTSIEATVLTDDNATKAHILEALKAISRKATPDDVVVVFLAGHGRTVDGHYFFAPHDVGHDPALMANVQAAKTEETYDAAADAVFRAEGLGQQELLPIIQGMQATRIAFILDTCYSATLAEADSVLRRDVNATITNGIGHASGRFVLSGSFTEAFDSAAGADAAAGQEGHGLFTSFLLRALKGDAGSDDEGRIDIYKLATYTREHVANASRQILEQSGATPGQKAPDVQRPAYFFAGNDFFALHKIESTATK